MTSRPWPDALAIAQRRVDAAEDNRRAMPLVAEAVAMFRGIFGDGVRVTYAEEAGRTLGQKDAREWCVPRVNPPDIGIAISLPRHKPKKRSARPLG